jgi:hypothetical protein
MAILKYKTYLLTLSNGNFNDRSGRELRHCTGRAGFLRLFELFGRLKACMIVDVEASPVSKTA